MLSGEGLGVSVSGIPELSEAMMLCVLRGRRWAEGKCCCCRLKGERSEKETEGSLIALFSGADLTDEAEGTRSTEGLAG